MQQYFSIKPAQSVFLLSFVLAGCGLFLALGCIAKPTPPTEPTAKPVANVALKVSCPDVALANVLGPIGRSWGNKRGITITFSQDANPDVVVLRPIAFGEAAAIGRIVALPRTLRDLNHPYQLGGVSDAFLEGIAGWTGKPFGIVLGAEAAVLVYRKDRFDESANRAEFKTRTTRELSPPSSWEDTAIIADFFREKDGKPSLPPLPQDPSKLLDLYNRVAACTDRAVITPSSTGGRILTDPSFAAEVVSFHFRFENGQPRLTSPGFALAAEILAKLQPSRMTTGSDDPIASLEAGAVLAVCTMSDLARLPKSANGAVLPQYGIARLPGTKRYYDNLTKSIVPIAGADSNFVPYFAGGWVGAVTKDCKNPDAAFELLAEFGGPTGTTAIVGEPACGSGPWRGNLLDSAKKNVWYAYGLGTEQTDALLRALKLYVAGELRNPVIGPRGPGIDKLLNALEPHIRAAITGKVNPKDALAAAQAEWQKLEKEAGPEAVKWRKADMRGE